MEDEAPARLDWPAVQNRPVGRSAGVYAQLLEEATADIPNVRVSGFDGLIVDFCREIDAVAIVKGLRGAGDYEYELPMAQMNSHLTRVETVFLPGAVGNAFVSSSLIKEVAGLGGDVSGLVPEPVREALVRRLGERRA